MIVVPLWLARKLVKANWTQCGAAFLILWGGLLLLFLLSAGTLDERMGWAMIYALFLTLPGVPIIALVVKRLGLLQ